MKLFITPVEQLSELMVDVTERPGNIAFKKNSGTQMPGFQSCHLRLQLGVITSSDLL